MVKYLKKIFLSGTKKLMTLKADVQHRVPEYVQIMTLVDHDLFYGKVKFCPLYFCMGRG